METRILTPIQLWQDFKPTISNFKTNIVNFEKTDNGNIYELYFTAFTANDGDVRIFCKIFLPKNNISSATVLMINEFEQEPNQVIVDALIETGHSVVTFDYCGEGYGKNFTRYPNSLSFGNFKQSGDHLSTCNHGANNTSLFLWCKITRHVISFIQSFSNILQPNKLFALAAGSGANILWQVAGVDNRLAGIIPLNNTGFDCFNGNTTSFENLSSKEFAERTLWSICCAAPSYAKFINCPTLFLGASNNADYDYSTLSDILKLIPEGVPHFECMSIGCSKNLYKESKTAILNWIDEVASGKPLLTPPKISFLEQDCRLYAQADFDNNYDDIVSAELCVSYGSTHDCLKNWKVYNVGVNLMGKASLKIKVYDLNEPIQVTAVVTYRNGSMYTAPLQTIVAKDISPDIKTSVKNKRIIYDKKLGVNAIFPREESYFADKNAIRLECGALDITGITTSSGDLVCYNVEELDAKAEDILLQFDCYTTQPRSFFIEVQDTNLVTYRAEVFVDGLDEWQNVKISYNSFVSDAIYPLKTWKGVRMIAFCKAENVLFNNIIWL